MANTKAKKCKTQCVRKLKASLINDSLI